MDSLPIFPLPNFVLFPRTHAPLHIFEPRYRQLMADVLAGDRRLGLVQLKPGYEKSYFERPRIYKMMTIGRILLDEITEDGRYNVLVEGIERAEVLEEVDSEPYRRVRHNPVADELAPEEREEVLAAANECARLAEAIGQQIAPKARALRNMLNTLQHPGIVADVAASLLVFDPYTRQSILEQTSVLRRVRMVNIALSHIQSRINAGDLELPVAEG